MVSPSIVADANNRSRRAGDTSDSTRAMTVPIPFSIPATCVGVKRFASCAVVVDAGVGYRFQLLPGGVRAAPVHPDQEIRTGQLRRRHRHQQGTRR